MSATRPVAVVTGANSGIGFETARALARDHRVLLVCRDEGRGRTAVQRIIDEGGDATLLIADLSSLESVRKLAAEVAERAPKLDVLVNNAAVWPGGREETVDGFELQLAVNHLAPFLLTNLLIASLERARGRIVTVASALHTRGRIDWDDLQAKNSKYSPMQVYSNTKLMNVLFTIELARRYKSEQLTANCLHPGVVATNLFRTLPAPISGIFKLFLKSPMDGAKTSIFLARDDSVSDVTGEYFIDRRIAKASQSALDPELAERLWTESATLVRLEEA